jgi:hypothetical protein
MLNRKGVEAAIRQLADRLLSQQESFVPHNPTPHLIRGLAWVLVEREPPQLTSREGLQKFLVKECGIPCGAKAKPGQQGPETGPGRPGALAGRTPPEAPAAKRGKGTK